MNDDQSSMLRALVAAMRSDPLDEMPRLILADWLGENEMELWAIDSLRMGRIPLTNFDALAIAQLHACTFLPASMPKRFARQLYDMATAKHASVTPKQYRFLWVLVHSYRRQIVNAAVREEASRVHAGNKRPLLKGFKQSELFTA